MEASTLTRLSVLLAASDPISKAGVAAALRSCHEVVLVGEHDAGSECVVLTIADRLDEELTRQLRARQAHGQTRFVLVTTELADRDLLVAVELGIRAVARRSEATPEALVRLIRTAATGEAALPPDLLGRLLTQVSRLQRQVLTPRGLNMAGLSERESLVLKLVADGWDTAEIAVHLSYSQRTVKTILHDVVNRFQLRNRTHAVAYALRQGLI
jgi:DNA-binding NarL/FixJ family response regulator